MDESETSVKMRLKTGTTRAIPPKAAMSRVCRRSYSMPIRKKSAPVERPWLIMTIRAPCTLCSVAAQMPSMTNPRWLTDEYATSFLMSGWTMATSAP